MVSAQAEADYDLGRRVNLRGTDAVVDACRALVAPAAAPPRVVFTSSVASFSGGQNAVLGDDARQMPANSYGAQKAAAELILADATRRGFLDAVSIRLPTVIVRPGRPNKAASCFFSAIIREPLLGLSDRTAGATRGSPPGSPARAAPSTGCCTPPPWTPRRWALDRSINPPGISATVAEMLAALDRVKPGAADLVRRVEDPAIAAIVGTWPAAFIPARAEALGFAPHEPLVEVVRAFIADDLEATRAGPRDSHAPCNGDDKLFPYSRFSATSARVAVDPAACSRFHEWPSGLLGRRSCPDVPHADSPWRIRRGGHRKLSRPSPELRPTRTTSTRPDDPRARTSRDGQRRRRRPFGDMVLHAPQTLRALVRTDEIWLVVLSAFIGCGAGILVWLMTETTQLIHEALFGSSSTQRL